jgi:hypothetical protein
MFNIRSPKMLKAIQIHKLERVARVLHDCPKDTVYVCGTYNTKHVERLAWHLKRYDITVVSPTANLRKYSPRYVLYSELYVKLR